MKKSVLKNNNIEVRREGMRICGEKVFTDDVIKVHYPYTEECIGTVPAGKAEHAAQAFEIAAAYKSALSRYERQKILLKTDCGGPCATRQRSGDGRNVRTVIPIVRVPDDDDAVMKISNGTEFGLSSGVCTNNLHRAIGLH